MAKDGSLGIGQASQLVHADDADEFADAVADAVVHSLVPLHVAHGRKEVAKGFRGTQLPYGVLGSLLNADDASYRSLYVAIAGCLAAPGRAVDDCLVANNTNHRIIVIHQVATWDVVIPESRVGTFSCAARCCHEVAFSCTAYDGGVHEHGAFLRRGKGIGHHHGVVESVVVLLPGLSEEGCLALAEVNVATHAAACLSVDVTDDVLVASIVHLVDSVDGSSAIELPYLIARLAPFKVVNDSHHEEKAIALGTLLKTKGRERGKECFIVPFVLESNGEVMPSYAVKTAAVFHHFLLFFLDFCVSIPTDSSGV